jgi:hypothetical protein
MRVHACTATSLAIAVLAFLGGVFLGGFSASADALTQCTRLRICYCVNTDMMKEIDRRVQEIRAMIADQRNQGKAIGYISIPISTTEGSYLGFNKMTAAGVKAYVEGRLGSKSTWMLNTADDNVALARTASGADYMLMWTRVLEGADGLAPDFDFVYFVGPSDFARQFAFDLKGGPGKQDSYMDRLEGYLDNLDNYYDRQSATDDNLKKIDKKSFRNYYGLRASVAFSYGSHDEWNIVRTINEKRRNADAKVGIAKQLAVFFDGRPLPPGLFETAVEPGNAGVCQPN